MIPSTPSLLVPSCVSVLSHHPNPAKGLGEQCKLPCGIWDRALAADVKIVHGENDFLLSQTEINANEQKCGMIF